MKKRYEVWDDSDADCISISFAEAGTGNYVPEAARLLYTVEADTYEEAMAVHHIKMGWQPYVPMGEPNDCPNKCGAIFYPEGSGECPNCGRIT